MKEEDEGGREGGGGGGKEVKEGRARSLFKEGTPFTMKNRWLCPSQFQPLEDADSLEARIGLEAWGPGLSGPQLVGVPPLALQPPQKLRRCPYGWGGVGKSSA